MNNRNITGQHYFYRCLCSTFETGLGNKEKESKASERKHTYKSFIFHLLFLCTIIIVTSCTHEGQYDFKSSDDAISEYNNLYEVIRSQHACDAEQLVQYINQWHEYNDTVYNYIQKDPAFSIHADLSFKFEAITDSIRISLLHQVGEYTLSDVAFVKLHTSKFQDNMFCDTLIKDALSFCESLNKIPIYDRSEIESLKEYSQLLVKTKKQGIDTPQELLDFIRAEDRHFRTFIANIDKYTSFGLSDITDNTSAICEDIYRKVSQKILPVEATLVYMSMRTNRRLLLNAKVCYDGLKSGKIADTKQANAYLWMLLQPYLSMDALGISMLTAEQKQLMMDMAQDFPSIIDVLGRQQLVDRKEVNMIPPQILRLYISSI